MALKHPLQLVLAAAVALAGCGETPLVPDDADVDESLVLVLSDTMRRDRLGLYGGPEGISPNFDTFARDGIVFDRAYTNAPWTKPSITTLFTSLHPSQHEVLGHPKKSTDAEGNLVNDVLSDGFTTLAEVLADEGFRTAAFVGNPWMDERFGFAQGFDTYVSFDWTTPGDEISAAALEWLDTVDRDERFFLYVHYMDCHQPYPPPQPRDVRKNLDRIAADDRPMMRGLKQTIPQPLRRLLRKEGVDPSLALVDVFYELGVAEFDEAFGALLDGLDDEPAADDAAIVVTSDHGEALFERGYGNHGRGLYEDELAIPLAAQFPATSASGVRHDLVGLVDLAPTLLGRLGVPVPDTSQGRDVFSATPRATLVSEGVANKPANRAVYHGDLKLLWQPHGGPAGRERAVFDVADDPGEDLDLLDHGDVDTEVVDELLGRAVDEVPVFEAPERGVVPLDEDMQQRLRDLGYIK